MKRVKINKKTIAGIALVILLAAGFVVASLYTRKDTNDDTTVALKQVVKEKACGLITLDEAKRVFGGDIKQENHAPTKNGYLAADTKKQTVLPSVCVYTSAKSPEQYPTTITVLPTDNDELDVQLQTMTAGGQFKKIDEYGNKAFQETATDRTGKKYSRVVAGYDNAIVTISLGESEGSKIKPLVDVMHAKVQDD
jgi:hypothetical protein